MQAVGVSRALSLWAGACQSVQVGEEPLVIVDYASSQGRNSMSPVRTAIETIRSRCGVEKLVEVIHTDLPSNDFSSLFAALEQEPDSYLRGIDGVFPAAIGRSYFEPLLPPGRVHLGWNTFSMQWMSRTPADAPDHILAGMSASAPVIAAVKEQQAAGGESGRSRCPYSASRHFSHEFGSGILAAPGRREADAGSHISPLSLQCVMSANGDPKLLAMEGAGSSTFTSARTRSCGAPGPSACRSWPTR